MNGKEQLGWWGGCQWEEMKESGTLVGWERGDTGEWLREGKEAIVGRGGEVFWGGSKIPQ